MFAKTNRAVRHAAIGAAVALASAALPAQAFEVRPQGSSGGGILDGATLLVLLFGGLMVLCRLARRWNLG